MLAVIRVHVPFELLLVEGATYALRSYSKDGYTVRYDLPVRTAPVAAIGKPNSWEVDTKAAFPANVLTITFQKDHFQRELGSAFDPSSEIINATLGWFLDRLKFIAKAHQVHSLEFPNCLWQLRYLNDDGTELPKVEGFVRGRGTTHFGFSYVLCDPPVWDQLFSLPIEFEPPAWHALLVDARGALPHVGTAVVLAATALEVLIASVLEKLAPTSAVPPLIWTWINDRGNWQKEPSVEEQFDILLNALCGHSLKEEPLLWEGMKNLRSVRNAFVHEGVPRLSRKTATPIDVLPLLDRAEQIASKIREWLPDEHKWPVLSHSAEIRVGIPLGAHDVPLSQQNSEPPHIETEA